jgi:hypothetical protein
MLIVFIFYICFVDDFWIQTFNYTHHAYVAGGVRFNQ